MKKFSMFLVLLAVAFQFSSASLWAQEVKEQIAVEPSGEVAPIADNAELALEAAAVKESENAATEESTPVVAKPAVDAAKAAVPAVMEEEKKEELQSVLPETIQGQDKIS